MKKHVNLKLENQLKLFQQGIPPYRLSASAQLDNGIEKFTTQELEGFEKSYAASTVTVQKFVPASGAATRMFKDLLELKSEGKASESTKIFFANLGHFPFGLRQSNPSELMQELFDKRAIDQLPKGLLPFHKYDQAIRTAAEEHLAEGLKYARKGEVVRIHFTVSPEHLDAFKKHLEHSSKQYPCRFEISFSTQHPETDTVAVDLNNKPVMDHQGQILYRPSGHGALLRNLNELEADIVFIKNIDNVVPDRLKKETIRFKKILAGILLDYQNKAFALLRRSSGGEDVQGEGRKLLNHVGLKGQLSCEQVLTKLNRPIRVCGMVRNQGEPGGGPFWVQSNNEHETLQIVESAQIDRNDSAQDAIFKQSTHFNPVDLVCGVKDYLGNKFDLLKYRDPATGFISRKSYQGQAINALELPGLWNGSMADWNTIFVEVPLITFNPVKTVNDLLNPEHQYQRA